MRITRITRITRAWLLPRFVAGSRNKTMGRQAGNVLYVLAMVGIIVGIDVLFFKHYFWERLAVNVGIVLVFVAFYFRYLKRP